MSEVVKARTTPGVQVNMLNIYQHFYLHAAPYVHG
jgi:hypothetical protein